MRDVFSDIFSQEPADPMESARRAMRPALRRRFYQATAVAEGADGFALRLDGKVVRTPARHALAAPTRPLAEAIAAEWDAQAELIDPAKMPLTRLANTIIDGVVASAASVAAEVAKYLGSDLVLYRADAPEQLVRRQSRHWDPVVAWARDELGARLILAGGVVHVQQPDHALAAGAAAIPRDPWRLGAVHAVTTLTGSALIALGLAYGRLSTEQAWETAHVDEDWNMEQWGRDALALDRRSLRLAEMQAAATVLALTEGE
jgi:chaperone required for assembly of F1-ATPase